MENQQKIQKGFRFGEDTISRLKVISNHERRSQNSMVEYLINVHYEKLVVTNQVTEKETQQK